MPAFLFTDIEGSTALWETLPDAMRIALRRHDALLVEAILGAGGRVFKTIGDAFCAVFDTSDDALSAALAAQGLLDDERWPRPLNIRVRMAVHVGDAESRDDDFFGPTVNRVARLLSVAHGGQIVVSETARRLLDDRSTHHEFLRDLGDHRLKDIGVERIWQWGDTEFPPLKSLRIANTNLPIAATSFIGRADEMRDARALLESSRLVTFLGPGGTGKTRLALQIAAERTDPDGVWLVELAPLSSPDAVVAAVAQTLGAREIAGQTPMQSLCTTLGSRRMLLILDNAEHVVAAVALLANVLLAQCPQLRMIVTSREGLQIPGETLMRLQPLPEFDAVRLFFERALQIRPDLPAAPDDPFVPKICRRLDGIPLAIELAAARTRALSVEAIESRLDDRFRLLTGGSRAALPRQQTLRALIDWSYDLLDLPERALFLRLGVFAGSFSLEDAEAVCPDDGIDTLDVMDLLVSLVEKSLVVHEVGGMGDGRYRLLESIRAYALLRSKESGDESGDGPSRLRRRHRDRFFGRADTLAAGLAGKNPGESVVALTALHANLLAAMEYAVTDRDIETAIRVNSRLGRYWELHGHLSEGRRLIEMLLACDAPVEPGVRATGLQQCGAIAWRQGDYPAARARLTEALALCEMAHDISGMAAATGTLANVAYYQGAHDEALGLYRRAVEQARQCGDTARLTGGLNNLALALAGRGENDEAILCYNEALQIRRGLGDATGQATLLGNLAQIYTSTKDFANAWEMLSQALEIQTASGDKLGSGYTRESRGRVALRQGDLSTARDELRRSVAPRRGSGEPWGIATLVESFAELASASGSFDAAARLWGAHQGLREAIGAKITPYQRETLERYQQPARESLGDDAFDRAYAEGAALSAADALTLAESV